MGAYDPQQPRRKRGRPRRSASLPDKKQVQHPAPGVRYCFSVDGVYCGDGLFRWWQERDDSGYNWNGFFDIIDLTQLRCNIKACQALGIAVFEKCEYATPEKDKYDPLGTVVGHERYSS